VAALLACPAGEFDPLGADPSIAAQPGEARAGVIREGGETDLALVDGMRSEGKAGDTKLWNDRVQFVVQGAYESHGIVDVGGTIIDADLVRPDGGLERDSIEDLFLAFGLSRLAEARSVEVLDDGRSGGPAIVRVTASDRPWRFMTGVFGTDQLLPDYQLEIVTDYALPPDSWTLTVKSRITNRGAQEVQFEPVDGVSGLSTDQELWTPDSGLAGVSESEFDSVGIAGRRGEPVLLLWLAEGRLRNTGFDVVVPEAGIGGYKHDRLGLGPGDSVLLERFWTLAPDTATAAAERLRHLDQPLGTVNGRVSDQGNGGGVPGLRVHFVGTGDHRTHGYAVSDAEGRFSVSLPPGDYLAYPVAQAPHHQLDLPAHAGRYPPFGHPNVQARALGALRAAQGEASSPMAIGRPTPPPEPVNVRAGQASEVSISMQSPARLRVAVRDEMGTERAALLQAFWAAGGRPDSGVPAAIEAALGIHASSDPVHRWWLRGDATLDVHPGVWDLEVDAGPRHERLRVEGVDLRSGELTDVDLQLQAAVARDGWWSSDPHLHAAPSSDGRLPMEARIAQCAGLGVDLPISTDHDRHVDYRPLAAALGLEAQSILVPGVEVSPILEHGHFNMYPLPPRPGEINGGAFRWWLNFGSTEELFANLRSNAGSEAILQVNHGRGLGMMDFADYDPNTGQARNADAWSWSFDAFELINGGSTDNWVAERRDWFSWLQLGHRKIPTGVSDSHSLGSPCGRARTDVYLGVERLSEVGLDAFRDAFVAGRVVATNGPTLRVFVDGQPPGSDVAGTSPVAAVEVLAPSWIVPEALRVYRNGQIFHEVALPAAAVGGVWFRGDIELTTGQDAWFSVEISGGQPMGGAYGATVPYAMTNAFFVDSDGDGWSPPGL
jgi:hypothetical protein